MKRAAAASVALPPRCWRVWTAVRRMSIQLPLGATQQDQYRDYLSAVQTSIEQTDDVGRRRRRPTKLLDESSARFYQRRKFVQEIRGTIEGPDTYPAKLRRSAELFWAAQESCVLLPVSAYESLLTLFLSFSPFPSAKEIGFDRVELSRVIYSQAKSGDHLPSVHLCELMLRVLATVRLPDEKVFAKAVGVLQDLGPDDLSPDALSTFCVVCRYNDRMDRALRVYDKYKETGGKMTGRLLYTLLNGLRKCDLIEEGLRLMCTVRGVMVSSVLATAAIDLLAHSRDPLSAFSLYRACFVTRELVPTVEVYDVLLTAVARCQEGMKAVFVQYICQEMRTHRVRTDNPGFLNRLVISLFAVKQHEMGATLYKSLRARGIELWAVTTRCIPEDMSVATDEEFRKQVLVRKGSVIGFDVTDARDTRVHVDPKAVNDAVVGRRLHRQHPEVAAMAGQVEVAAERQPLEEEEDEEPRDGAPSESLNTVTDMLDGVAAAQPPPAPQPPVTAPRRRRRLPKGSMVMRVKAEVRAKRAAGGGGRGTDFDEFVSEAKV